MQALATPTSELKKKLVSQAIQDPLFKSSLRDAANEIKKISAGATNEATIEGAFERIVYALLKDIGLTFHPDKETPVKTKRHTARGRTDSRIGAIVIEYKQPSTFSVTTDIAKATQQITDYVSAISLELKNEVVGFLTDGTKVREFRASEGKVTSSSALSAFDDLMLARFVRSVISLERSALSAKNLIRDFCGATYDGIIFRVARELSDVLAYKATIKTEMLRTEWEHFSASHMKINPSKRGSKNAAVYSAKFLE